MSKTWRPFRIGRDLLKFTIQPHQFLIEKLKGLSDSSKVPKLDNAKVNKYWSTFSSCVILQEWENVCASRGRDLRWGCRNISGDSNRL